MHLQSYLLIAAVWGCSGVAFRGIFEHVAHYAGWGYGWGRVWDGIFLYWQGYLKIAV
jgi:hypothetical protein